VGGGSSNGEDSLSSFIITPPILNITYPNGSFVQKSMDHPGGSLYNTSLFIQSSDRYNITFVANDTADNRETAALWFNATAFSIPAARENKSTI